MTDWLDLIESLISILIVALSGTVSLAVHERQSISHSITAIGNRRKAPFKISDFNEDSPLSAFEVERSIREFCVNFCKFTARP